MVNIPGRRAAPIREALPVLGHASWALYRRAIV